MISITDVEFIPRRKYSFELDGTYYCGIFLQEMDGDVIIDTQIKQKLYVFNTFSIMLKEGAAIYLSNLKAILPPRLTPILKKSRGRFSDSETDGICESEDTTESDDYITIDFDDIGGDYCL